MTKRLSDKERSVVLTAVEVDDEWPAEVSVPHERGVHARTRCVVDTEVIELFVSPEEVAFLLVYHKFLRKKRREIW